MSRIKRFISLSWMSVMFHMCLVFSGITLSLMVVIDDMAEDLQTTTASVGIILSMYIIPFAISGPLMSHALQTVGCRGLLMIGGVLVSSGIFMVAFAQRITFIAIGFSFISGIGSCAIYTACTTAIRLHYSNRHYALANGAAITGIPLSMFVFSPILRALVFIYGWRGALVIASATSLNSVVIGALMKPKYIRKRAPAINDDDKVFEDKNDVDSVKEGNNDVLIPLSYDHRSTVLPTVLSQGKTSCKGVAKDLSGSAKNLHTSNNYSRVSQDSPVPFNDVHFDKKWNKEIHKELHASDSAGSNLDDELHVSTQGTQSIVSTMNKVINDGQYGFVNDLPCDNPEPSKCMIVKSRISKLFKLSTKPLNRTTKTCHLILYIAILFSSATYTTCSVFLVPAGTHGGLAPMQAATLYSGFGISNAVGRFCNGILVTKGYIKATHLYIVMQILMAASALVLGFLMRVYLMAILGSLVLGVSVGAIISLNIVMQRAIDDCATSISLGWLLFVEGSGGFFGSLSLGSLKYLTDSFVPMFVIAAVFSSVSAALSVLILILKRKEVSIYRARRKLSCLPG